MSLSIFAQKNTPTRACALPGPTSTCTKVEANGDVTLSWTIPIDPNSVFVRYEVFRIGSLGAIQTIPTFTSQNSITINSIFAGSDFYIGVVSLCGGIEEIQYGDTVKAMDLKLSNQVDGRAGLTWNTPSIASNEYFQIERQHPNYGWSIRDSIKSTITDYTDTIDVCSAFLNYQIVINQTGCKSYSNIVGDNFKDVIPPTIPIIKSISYDTTTKGVTLNWYKNPARDVKGYLVKIAYDGSPLSFIDSVESKNNKEPLSYNLVNAPLNSAITFSISAYDSCLSSSPPNNQLSGNSEPHTGFNLKNTYDLCHRVVSLNWTKYIGWKDIIKYKIYAKKENGFWKLLDSTTQQSFQDTLLGFKNYEFIIQALNTDSVTTFSNPIKLYTKAPTLPSYNYTKVANTFDKYIQLTHLIDNVGGVSKIILEKKNKEGIFKEIQVKTVSSNTITFNDSLVDTPFENYTYRTRIIDSCGNKTSYGNEVTNILLKIENKQSDSSTLANTFSWSPYIGFNGNILNYAIYRKLKGVFDPTPIAILPSTQLSYTDNLINQPNFTGQVCYYVTAIESDNIYKQASIANSNVVCVTFEPLIFVPNAFTPHGKNPIFYPVISMFEPKEYSLTIMNRWGQPVFRSLEYTIGWDGMFGDEMSPNGNYMYVIRYLDGDNKEYIEHGFVTLIF
jgi:gliding motility-associated-like protein